MHFCGRKGMVIKMNGKICMIAHRGYSSKYKQNTELAFIKAAEHKSGGAETDIRVTKDNVLVCSHDRNAVFEDGTELIVEEATFAQLTEKPLMNSLTGDKVYLCTFRRYLEIMKENGMICFIELKGSFSDEKERQVYDAIKEVYSIDKCILQSFDFDNLVRMHKSFPDLPLMFTYGTCESGWERCFDYGISLDADLNVLTDEMLEAFHAHGLEVGVWTANTPEDFEKCKAKNLDYIESDVYGGGDL